MNENVQPASFSEVNRVPSNIENDDIYHSSSDCATDGNFTDRKFSALNSEFKNIISQALFE